MKGKKDGGQVTQNISGSFSGQRTLYISVHDRGQAGEVTTRRGGVRTRARIMLKNEGALPLTAVPSAYQLQMQQVPEEPATQAAKGQTTQTVPGDERRTDQEEPPETVDVEKIADMVYRMLRQDLIVEMERFPRRRRSM